ncbi:MAG: hypothetical protein Q8O88_05680 [bacterium]|nr:hypothetical protein [bacterium]
MKGKIFPESSNIYQDQAKILFNYYQQMAEKIVQEEERFEKEIAKLEEEKTVIGSLLLNLWTKFKLWIQGKLKKTKLELKSIKGRIAEFHKLHTEIFRDYKVSKLGVAYIPIAKQIEYENKSFIVDHTGMVEESEVKLQLSKQNDLLIDTISELEKLSAEAPIVESSNEIEEIETENYSRSMQHLNQHDYFGKLERSLRTISYCMDDLDITSVELPLVANESSYFNFLKEYATNEVPPGSPIFEAFDTTKYNDQISKFQELNKLKDSLSRDTVQFEEVLKELMTTMANSVQAISALKIASTDKIVFESNKVLYKILKSPYNHYSPILEAPEIERIRNESFNYGESVSNYVPFQLKDSSKVKFNLVSGMWTAEDGSTTNFPFGVHQIQEEIVAPIVQNLMNETRIERLKIYNHIKDQKINYLNKWHQDTEDFYGRNRAESADLINLMRASLRDYVAAYNTLESLKKTEDSMAHSDGSLDSTVVTATENSAEVYASFELQSNEFQKVQLEFENYMERLKEDIDLKAQRFEHIDYYDALLRDGNSKDIAVAAHEARNFDMRRKPLISVNPLFAKVSDLPPTPSIEDITYEHISLNLPLIAKATLQELEDDLSSVPNMQSENGFNGTSTENSDTNEIQDDASIDNNYPDSDDSEDRYDDDSENLDLDTENETSNFDDEDEDKDEASIENNYTDSDDSEDGYDDDSENWDLDTENETSNFEDEDGDNEDEDVFEENEDEDEDVAEEDDEDVAEDDDEDVAEDDGENKNN